jgi:hypothetical protein
MALVVTRCRSPRPAGRSLRRVHQSRPAPLAGYQHQAVVGHGRRPRVADVRRISARRGRAPDGSLNQVRSTRQAAAQRAQSLVGIESPKDTVGQFNSGGCRQPPAPRETASVHQCCPCDQAWNGASAEFANSILTGHYSQEGEELLECVNKGTSGSCSRLPEPLLVRYNKWSRRRSQVVRQGFAKPRR